MCALTHWPLGDINGILDTFQANFDNCWLRYPLNCTQTNVTGPH